MDPRQKCKKHSKSCVFCRRSHIVCDGKRPCARCVKREIAHICKDDDLAIISSSTEMISSNENLTTESANVGSASDMQADAASSIPISSFVSSTDEKFHDIQPTSSWLQNLLPSVPTFASQNAGSEFSSLNEFLNMLEDPLFQNNAVITPQEPAINIGLPLNTSNIFIKTQNEQVNLSTYQEGPLLNIVNDSTPHNNRTVLTGITTPKEHFFLTAADPATEISPEERLKLVIKAKLEAGLLQPYNYAQGYARLQNYMDRYMNESSKQRILSPLSTIRPAFRAIAKSLKDVDLVLVEEGFERMLLSYDRVFTSMSIPACLWRRTGEIYRANKEFASLVDCTVDDLRDGRLAIYELMTEESAVNFWEKYGSIAFDKGQKAVLTSCNLRTRDGRRKRPSCFSFTIRRDRYNIPICIIGNFIPIS